MTAMATEHEETFVTEDVLDSHGDLAKLMRIGDKCGATAFLSDFLEVPVTLDALQETKLVVRCTATGLRTSLERIFSSVNLLSKEAPEVSATCAAVPAKTVTAGIVFGCAPFVAATIDESRHDIKVHLKINANIPVPSKRPATQAWLRKLVESSMQEKIGKCIPRNQMVFADLNGVTLIEYQTLIQPAWERVATLKVLESADADRIRHTDRAFAERRQAQAAQVGDLKQTVNFLDRLTVMRGTGGAASKCRRFADRSLETYNLSQRVCAAGLREAREAPIEDADDME